MNTFDIKHAFYINLTSRPDRKSWCELQMQTVGIQATRFNAIKLQNGAIGCTMSHLKCLQMAKEQGWDHLLIVEDDIEFTNPQLFKRQFEKFLTNTPKEDWDVVIIAGNNMPPYEVVADYCVKVTKCQTTTSYLVNGHYFDALITNIKDGLQFLIKEPHNHRIYAIDKYWFKLQQKDKWFLITPLSVVQRQDYSDIEQRITNYGNVMLDLDKKKFFAGQLEKIKQAEDQLTRQPTSPQQILQFQQLQIMREQIEEELKFFDH
jgi:glycosyl transferase family 25